MDESEGEGGTGGARIGFAEFAESAGLLFGLVRGVDGVEGAIEPRAVLGQWLEALGPRAPGRRGMPSQPTIIDWESREVVTRALLHATASGPLRQALDRAVTAGEASTVADPVLTIACFADVVVALTEPDESGLTELAPVKLFDASDDRRSMGDFVTLVSPTDRYVEPGTRADAPISVDGDLRDLTSAMMDVATLVTPEGCDFEGERVKLVLFGAHVVGDRPATWHWIVGESWPLDDEVAEAAMERLDAVMSRLVEVFRPRGHRWLLNRSRPNRASHFKLVSESVRVPVTPEPASAVLRTVRSRERTEEVRQARERLRRLVGPEAIDAAS